VIIYRSLYLVAAVLNLVLVFHLDKPVNKKEYAYGTTLVLVNVVSWISYLSGTRWGASSEKILSVCRMLTIVVLPQ